ncbi:hypothetical protein BLA60_36400 [Actinophytocola xinjiangensis]|uniref:DUF397 domain-containing protein n=1 Tax=Actinophytocola xinjiangensis TaxID=485602 RepID=A0A7Z0WF22_9PSEU|nr:DUF397 domain-containing protein [Actinophytocola xinjiangensis]OLF05316.1 hypothetical protein BLA60_36400 [Actinophytocola xinjiangensis]
MDVCVRWRKSTRSQNTTNCVEVSNLGAIRDSKNPGGPTLPGAGALLAVVKAGALR